MCSHIQLEDSERHKPVSWVRQLLRYRCRQFEDNIHEIVKFKDNMHEIVKNGIEICGPGTRESPGLGCLRGEYLITLAEIVNDNKMEGLESFGLRYLRGSSLHGSMQSSWPHSP